MTQALGKNDNILLLSNFHSVDVKVLCSKSPLVKQIKYI